MDGFSVIKGDRREPDVFEMASRRLLSCVHKWKDNVTQHAKCLFSTGWCHPTHCTIVNGRGSSHVSRKGHFTFRRHPVAPKVPWFDHLWLFYVGIPQITCLYSQTSHLVRSEGGNQGGSGNNWCWNAYTPIFSEGLKTAFKKVDTTCLTLSFIHNMQFKWHVITKIFL